MKILNYFRPSRSISTRLTWRVTLTVFIIMDVIIAVILGLLWSTGTAMLAIFFQTNLDVAEERISQPLTSVEITLQNYVPEVEERLTNPDALYSVVENIVTLNPYITGSAVAFEPNYFPQKGVMFAPYAYNDSTGVHTKQLGTSEYDYLHREWYVQAKAKGEGYWSEPYIDTGGGNMGMTTYSLPLFDKQGRQYATLTADISLDWLSELRAQMDSIFNNKGAMPTFTHGNSHSFIITQKGNFIASDTEQTANDKNIFDYIRRTCDGSNDTTVVANILSAQDGFSTFKQNDQIQFVHHSPVRNTNWAIAVITPFDDFTGVINALILTFATIIVLGLIIVAFVCHVAIHRTTKPLRQFARSADEIARGNFKTPLPYIMSKDEMRLLHDSFTAMQKSLTSHIEELKTVNEAKGRIEGELLTAHKIQMSMLPKRFPPFPERDDIDIYAWLSPAKEVGGDLYDYYIRDEKLFFCIGDVSGKGIPASLLMAFTRAMFRTLSTHESNPARIITHINEAMSHDNDSCMFVTLFVGVLDLPTGRLRFCNGGHNAPIAINGDDVHYIEVRPNLPIGAFEDSKYEGQETVMSPNASIFLFTDGLNEAENADHQELGDEQVLEKLREVRHASPRQQIEFMENVVSQHAGGAEQSDDLTMLIVKYCSPQHEIKMEKKLTLLNQVEEISKLAAFLEEIGDEAGLDMSLTMSLNLAVEEAVTNVILYAYPNGSEGHVSIDAQLTDQQLKFIITDEGQPFDPTAQEEADITLGVKERPIGGLGIFLVRKIMDAVNYERINDVNTLTLIKNLTTPQQQQA